MKTRTMPHNRVWPGIGGGGGANRAGPRPGKNTLIRQLALTKLRELRRQGLSYRDIGRLYHSPRNIGNTTARGPVVRVTPRELLAPRTHNGTDPNGATADHRLFLHMLDAVGTGLAFFDFGAMLLHTNQALENALRNKTHGEQLGGEVLHFAHSLGGLVRARATFGALGEGTEELAVREIQAGEARYRLRGSYIGLDLFGLGSTLLVALEPLATLRLSETTLRKRFGLSYTECRVAGLLAEGRSNAGIAAELSISPHTARHHTERVLQKLGVRSRAEVGHKLRSE